MLSRNIAFKFWGIIVNFVYFQKLYLFLKCYIIIKIELFRRDEIIYVSGVEHMLHISSRFKKILLICAVTAFMGQIYLNPFGSDFRFSLSVVAFSLFVFWYKELDLISTAFLTGVILFLFRSFIEVLHRGPGMLTHMMLIHYPTIIFYTFFGIFLSVIRFRNILSNKLMFLILLTISDGASNVIEIIIRSENVPKIQSFAAIFLVGFIRSFITLFVIEVLRYYEMLLMKEQHEERYKQLVLLTSNLKSEVFFLKKSMEDIEYAMEKSYQLYGRLKEFKAEEAEDYSFQALLIAKDIHEIKKDYLRVSAGLERIIPEMDLYEHMTIKDIFQIIESNLMKNTNSMDKDVSFEFNCLDDIYIKHSYDLISVINNLIINAIEAIKDRGKISVQAKINDRHFEIEVKDNGVGIAQENYGIIFEPGFTTKFDVKSGKMNAGIGLTHVLHIVKKQLLGEIELKSTIGVETVFTIRVPIKNI